MKPITHVTISMLMFLNIANSQTLDTTFGTNGIVVTDLTTQVDAIGDLVVRDNGKIVASGIGGNFITITQYLADGTLDNSFGNNGKVVTNFRSSFQNGAFSPIAIQTDGKILLLCQNFIQNVNNFILTRYNANGTLDTSFGTNGIVNNSQFNGFGNTRKINRVGSQLSSKPSLADRYSSIMSLTQPHELSTLLNLNFQTEIADATSNTDARWVVPAGCPPP